MSLDKISKLKIVIIGAGNVGSHLAQGLFERKCQIIQVFSRVKQKAKNLAHSVE